MAVLVLTIFVSLLLVASFIALFLYVTRDPHSDPDRDSLLPFQDERPPFPPPAASASTPPPHD